MPTTTTVHGRQAPPYASTKSNKKHTSLRRPQKPLNFDIARHQHATTTTSTEGPASPTQSTTISTLQKRVLLLDLIHRRNKNQHRAQPFFKHLCLLRSSLRRLLETLLQLETLSRETAKTPEKVRWRFELESQLRGRGEVLQEHIRETLVPVCYVSFSGLVGDSQFANLGVVLFALLTEIAAGEYGAGLPRRAEEEVGEAQVRGYRMAGSDAELGQGMSGKGAQLLVGTSTRITGEDQGEVIERVYESGDGDEIGAPAAMNEEIIPGPGGIEEQQQQQQKQLVNKQGIKTTLTASKGAEPTKRSKSAITEGPSEDQSEGKAKKKKKPKDTIDDLFSGLM